MATTFVPHGIRYVGWPRRLTWNGCHETQHEIFKFRMTSSSTGSAIISMNNRPMELVLLLEMVINRVMARLTPPHRRRRMIILHMVGTFRMSRIYPQLWAENEVDRDAYLRKWPCQLVGGGTGCSVCFFLSLCMCKRLSADWLASNKISNCIFVP